MSDLISRSYVIDLLYKTFDEYRIATDKTSTLGGFGSEVFKRIREMPTVYDIDKVVEELEQKKEEVQRMRNTCVALSDLEVCDIENVTYENAIEIVKHRCVSDDVCEWIKYDYRTMCPKNHDVKNLYWRIPMDMDKLKYCPYCGKKIKVVE